MRSYLYKILQLGLALIEKIGYIKIVNIYTECYNKYGIYLACKLKTKKVNILKFRDYNKRKDFAANSDFLTPISLQPNVEDLRYFKLCIL